MPSSRHSFFAFLGRVIWLNKPIFYRFSPQIMQTMVRVFFKTLVVCLAIAALVPSEGAFDGFPESYDGESMDIGAPCPEDNPKCCVTEGRLDSFVKFYTIQADTLSSNDLLHKRANSLIIEELYKNITTQECVLRVNGVGYFPTPTDAVEYMTMVQGTANNDLFVFLQINPNFEDIECVSEDRWNAFPIKTMEWLDPAQNGYLYEENEIRDTREPYTFTFAPKSSLISHITGQIPDPLTFVAVNKRQSVRTLCETALLYCPGDYYPYEGLTECYETMSRMANNCPDGKTDEPGLGGGSVQGDTLVCRFLHLISSNFRPEIHCAHLGNESVKCPAELCLSAPRLEEPNPVFEHQYRNASHGLGVRVFEMAALALILAMGLASMVWHRLARTKTFDLDDSGAERTALVNQSNASAPSTELPVIKFENMRLSWTAFNAELTDGIVVQGRNNFFGGCKMTGIVGESGAGKSTFLKLLSGFSVPHMELSFDALGNRPRIVYCPQFAEMWPKQMPVRDILMFSCKMVGVNAADFMDSFKKLGIVELFDQPFSTLSGGQSQRVNIATTLVHPNPSIIILDEPLASLDEDNAVAALEVLRELPTRHSFVMTVHQIDHELASRFDRIVHFDANKKSLVTLKGVLEAPKSEKDSSDHDTEFASTFSSIQACLTLWHGQIYGMPWLEFGMVLFTSVAAVFTALIGRPSLLYDQVPTMLSLRIPVYVSLMLFGATFMTSFGVSIVYAEREKLLVSNFVPQGALKSHAYILAMSFRSIFYGVIQATVWVLVSLPILGLWGDKADIVLANVAIFTAAWTTATFFAALAAPYAAVHIVMIMCVYAVFLSGPFNLWNETYGFIQFLQAVNPLFYVVSANVAVVLEYFDPGCDDLTHPGTCAQSNYILEMNQTQDVSSVRSQFGCLVVVALTVCATAFFMFPRSQVSSSKEVVDDPVEEAPSGVRSSVRVPAHQKSMLGGSGHMRPLRDVKASWKSIGSGEHNSILHLQLAQVRDEYIKSLEEEIEENE